MYTQSDDITGPIDSQALKDLQIAKALIRCKEYEDARNILRNIDEPIAYEWLELVDEAIARQNEKQLPMFKKILRLFMVK